MKLNGTTDYVDLGALGAVAAGTAAFTVSCYFMRDRLTGLTAMLGDANNAAQNHFNFQVNGPGRKLLSTLITTVGAKALVGLANIPMFQHCHGILTYDGATITFYYNGNFDNSTTHTGTILASTSGMQIGSGSAPVGGLLRFFGSRIGEMRYWTRALSATEAHDLVYDNRLDAAMLTGLAGEWLLVSNANDTSGGGNNGTIVGATFDSVNVPLTDRVPTTRTASTDSRGPIT